MKTKSPEVEHFRSGGARVALALDKAAKFLTKCPLLRLQLFSHHV